MIRFDCPACKLTLQVAVDKAGAAVACPRCKGQTRVPSAAAPAAVKPAAAPQWYFIRDKAKTGPVAFAQLQEMALTGRLAPADMVWREGLAQWAPASSVNGLCPAGAPPTNGTAVKVIPKTPPDSPPKEGPARPPMMERVQRVLDQFKGVLANLKEIKAGVLALVPAVPFLGGFIGDFLRPLAPFNFLFFLLSLLLTLTLVGLFIRFPRLLTLRSGFVCLSLGVVCLIFGLWWGLALFGSSGDKGFLASNVGVVHSLQTAVVTRKENAVDTDTSVKGGDLADEALREMRAEKDGEKLVAYALGGYPANVLKAEPVGDPKRKKGENDEIVLQYDLRIGVDQEQYDRIVEKKILPVLEKAATQKGESFSGAKAATESYAQQMLLAGFREARLTMRFAKMWEFDKGGFGDDWWQGEMDTKTEMAVVVNSKRSSTDDKLTWRWFHVPNTAVYNWNQRETGIKVNVSFRDKDGNELSRDQIEIDGKSLPGVHLDYNSGKYYPANELLVSPYMISNGYYSRGFQTTQEVHFTAADLAKFASIHCTVEPGAGAAPAVDAPPAANPGK